MFVYLNFSSSVSGAADNKGVLVFSTAFLIVPKLFSSLLWTCRILNRHKMQAALPPKGGVLLLLQLLLITPVPFCSGASFPSWAISEGGTGKTALFSLPRAGLLMLGTDPCLSRLLFPLSQLALL